MNVYSRNLQIIKNADPLLSVDNIAFSYGYGVYENIRVTNGQVRYLDEHLDRLAISADMLGIKPVFSTEQIKTACLELAHELGESTYNLKIILIGGETQELFILPLAPKFVDRKLYRTGVKVITVEYERYLPQAKSLNMLGSYLVYQQAQAEGAYDALLVDRDGEIPEGSRTNFYALKKQQIFTAPDDQVLAGVTRAHILEFAQSEGFEIVYQTPKLADLSAYDGFFISNTSSKLLPVSQINSQTFEVPADLATLAQKFKAKH